VGDAERKILRRIFCPAKDRSGTWRRKTNEELKKLIRNRNIINCIKVQRLNWFGHVHRITSDRIVKKLYKWRSIFTRLVGSVKFVL
jgi:hypothetical protein